MTPRQKPRLAATPTSKSAKPGLDVFPHQLRAGDIITDEHGDEWELVGQPAKSVGTQDFVTTIRRVDPPADTREARWRAHERVRGRRR